MNLDIKILSCQRTFVFSVLIIFNLLDYLCYFEKDLSLEQHISHLQDIGSNLVSLIFIV